MHSVNAVQTKAVNDFHSNPHAFDVKANEAILQGEPEVP
jgi:hypothetical protein